MTDRTVAVIAHRKKSLGGGLGQLRAVLADEGITPLWYEVSKSRKAPREVERARDAGAELVFVWGGDGMVQQCVDALAGSPIPVAVVPAGTANLLASNLGIPRDLVEAVRIGLYGRRRPIDLGRINGEHFAVMAGAGFDGALIADIGGRLKRRVGRLAYFWTGLGHVRDRAVPATVTIDGEVWFDGRASCVLVGNVGRITGGIKAFDDARPDDGWLDVGVATAEGALAWGRTLARMATGRSEASPFVQITRARRVEVTFASAVPYEMDGGARGAVDRIEVQVVPAGLTICVSDSPGIPG